MYARHGCWEIKPSAAAAVNLEPRNGSRRDGGADGRCRRCAEEDRSVAKLDLLDSTGGDGTVLDASGAPSIQLAMSLHLAASASYNLNRFNDSLAFLNRVNVESMELKMDLIWGEGSAAAEMSDEDVTTKRVKMAGEACHSPPAGELEDSRGPARGSVGEPPQMP